MKGSFEETTLFLREVGKCPLSERAGDRADFRGSGASGPEGRPVPCELAQTRGAVRPSWLLEKPNMLYVQNFS